MRILEDAFGREFHYLRLSVTDRCNYRCAYCLPSGCPKGSGAQPLSAAEVGRLVRGFADLGLWKVRLTGGEPTMRRDIAEVVARVAATPGVRRVGLTTNGHTLVDLAAPLRSAGLTSVNVSLDSLDPKRFEQITGFPEMGRVLAGVEAAVAAGIPSVKINAVLLRGLGQTEFERFLALVKDAPLTVRFIELMQTADNGGFFKQYHLPAEEVRRRLEERGFAALPKDPADGPAVNYGCAGYRGKVGLIAPYSRGFCKSCNRLRVSSTGDLRLCLFGDIEIPLRPHLESDDEREKLIGLIEASIKTKPASHLLQEGRCGAVTNLAATGG
ncbi:MAG TPA: GTP 3',8-cyclase MoaA [Anaeromyxobacteraceae bacterium]|nr:GTP 3',8-cyclase MoaA [Anaeromyxobacteraceae bacterium]